MQWSDRFATGFPQVDAQHRLIFKLSEDFQASLAAGAGERTYGELLRSLELFTRVHFGFEEGCMLRHHCPAARINKAAHAAFSAMLDEHQRRYAVVGFDPADAATLMHTIDRWLDDHICRIDVQLQRDTSAA